VFRGNSIGGVRKKRRPFLLLQHAWPPTLLPLVTLLKRIQHCRSIVLSQLQMDPQNNLKINLMYCQLIKEHGRSEPYPPPCHSPHTLSTEVSHNTHYSSYNFPFSQQPNASWATNAQF
jgi:hypothetical protein